MPVTRLQDPCCQRALQQACMPVVSSCRIQRDQQHVRAAACHERWPGCCRCSAQLQLEPRQQAAVGGMQELRGVPCGRVSAGGFQQLSFLSYSFVAVACMLRCSGGR